MAVTPFKFPLLFRKPENDKISKRSGVRLVAAACSNLFSPDAARYFKSRYELYIWKNASNKKKIFQIFAFLIIPAGL